MTKFGVAQPVRRVEDPRLLLGHGKYTDDFQIEGEAHLIVLRSPHAAATIVSIDADAARGDARRSWGCSPGRDLDADGIGGVPCAHSVEEP